MLCKPNLGSDRVGETLWLKVSERDTVVARLPDRLRLPLADSEREGVQVDDTDRLKLPEADGEGVAERLLRVADGREAVARGDGESEADQLAEGDREVERDAVPDGEHVPVREEEGAVREAARVRVEERVALGS